MKRILWLIEDARRFLGLALVYCLPAKAQTWILRRKRWCPLNLRNLNEDGPVQFFRDEECLEPDTLCFKAHPSPYDYCGHYRLDHPAARCLVKDSEARP